MGETQTNLEDNLYSKIRRMILFCYNNTKDYYETNISHHQPIQTSRSPHRPMRQVRSRCRSHEPGF